MIQKIRRVPERLDIGGEQQQAAERQQDEPSDHDVMRPVQHVQLCRAGRGRVPRGHYRREIRGDRAPATGDETAEVEEFDAGSERRVIGVDRGPRLEQMAEHVNDSRRA